MQRFSTQPRGPFKLATANQFFGGWASMGGDENAIVMTFPVEGWRTSAAVALHQDPDGTLSGQVHGPTAAPDAVRAWAMALAALSLDWDGSGYLDVGRRDPVVGRIQQEFENLRPVCFHSPYEAATSFVIGHRITVKQARTIRDRMAREHGDAIQVGDSTFHAFPRPEVLLGLTSFGQVAGEKMERVHAVAEAALAGRLDRDRLRSMPPDEALADLLSIRGVGPFTASGTLLRGAGLVDEVPDDEITRQAVQRAYDLPALPGRQEMLARAEAWRPYRMWTSVLLHAWFRRTAGPSRRR